MMQTRYSLRQVVDLTGASEFLLRAWEGRYQALNPRRTGTGRRLYTPNDVLKVRLLLNLTEQGFKISKTARLSVPELEKMLALPPSPTAPEASANPIQKLAVSFEWDELRRYLTEGRLSPRDRIFKKILPAAVEMNRLVDSGVFSIMHEHILSTLIKQTLARLKTSPRRRSDKRRLALATPEGDHHDLGILFAGKIAELAGVECLVLGAHMPKRELAECCIRYRATHLVLASSVSKSEGASEDWLRYVNFMDRTLPSSTHLWLAGRNALRHPLELKRPHRLFRNFEEFEMEVTS